LQKAPGGEFLVALWDWEGGIMGKIVIIAIAALLIYLRFSNQQPSQTASTANSSNSPATLINGSPSATVNNNSGNSTASVGGNNSGIIASQSGTGNTMVNNIGNTNLEPKTTGVLKPRDGGSVSDDAGFAILDDQTGIMTFYSPIGGSIFPFGQNVPFWVSKNRNGLLINAEIRSMDGKIMAELTDNEWRINPNNYFKLNYDYSGLEVVDDYGIPWLQVDYLTPSMLKIGGVFRGGEVVSPNTFPNFPTNISNGSIFGIGNNGIIIVGNGQQEIIGGISIETEAQKENFADNARGIIEPWFDYTPSRGLGVRISDPEVTTDPSTVQIPPSPVSGILEGQSFNCDNAVLRLMESTLVLSQGTGAVSRVEISLTLNVHVNPSGTFSIPINTIIPMHSVGLYWKNSGKSKFADMGSNSVARVWFDSVISNQMNGRVYIESPPRQRTKISGTFKAQFVQ
jgi:hypothetical protein